MGLKINFQFTMASIILALFAIAFSAVVNAQQNAQSDNPLPLYRTNCTTTTISAGTTTTSAIPNCFVDQVQYCKAKYAYDQTLITAGTTACSSSFNYDMTVKGHTLTGCLGQTASTCMTGDDDDDDPSDIADSKTVTQSCKTQMANTYCCRSQTDKTSAQTDDKTSQDLQEKLFTNQRTDQQNLQNAQNQMNQIQQGLTDKLLGMQNQLNQNQEAVGSKQDALNAQISADNSKIQGALTTIQTTISTGQQTAQAAYQAAMTQASADCRAMQFQYQQPGNPAQLGSLSNALNSASGGGLMNSRCGVGQASINTPWGQKFISEQSAAQQAYYSAIAALNNQVAQFKTQVLQIQSDITSCQQQISRLIANQQIEANQIQLNKNAATMTANQNIQTQMNTIQQIRQQDQQQSAALQQQLNNDMTIQKQSDSDFTNSNKYCQALQSYQNSTSCSGGPTTNITVGGSGSDSGSLSPQQTVNAAVNAQINFNKDDWGNCPNSVDSSWPVPTTPTTPTTNTATTVTPTTPSASQQAAPASVPDWCPSGDGCAEH